MEQNTQIQHNNSILFFKKKIHNKMNNITINILENIFGKGPVDNLEQYVSLGKLMLGVRFLVSSAIVSRVLSRAVITIASIALLPSQMVGYNLPRLKELRDDFKWKHQQGRVITEVEIPVNNLVSLNGLLVERASSSTSGSSSSSSSSFMIYLNANGMVYEDVAHSALELADALNRNLLLVNYKGVGKSQGKSERASDLIQDAVACLSYLKKKQIKEENILLWGHSIGWFFCLYIFFY